MVNWHQHTVVGVLLGWVVEHLNPIEHVLPCSVACGACPPCELVTLSQGERSFYHRVVTAIPTPVHDYIRVMFANKGLPRLAGELSALVRLDQNLVL